jgi:hypothetical protein
LPADTPSNSSGSATFSAAVNPANRLKSWNTYPMARRRSRARSSRDIEDSGRPATNTSPAVADSNAPAMVSNVLLPEPLGPITATIRPASTDRSTSRRACTSSTPSR